MARLVALLGVLGWLITLLLFASGLERAGRPRIVGELVPPPLLVQELNRARFRTTRSSEWAVTRATAAHHMLVADVDARDVAAARVIAAEIVGPAERRKYDEVLLYFWEADTDKPFADRRVQWTPAGGYAELVLVD